MKGQRVLIPVIFSAFLLLVGGFGYAQNAEGLKMAYVDLKLIFDAYAKTKEYDVALEKKHNVFQQEHNDKLQKIKDAEGKLALMKEEEKIKLLAQIDKDKADLLAFDRQKQTDLKKEYEEKTREILGDIEKVIKDLAVKENYTLIFNDRVLVYGADNLNLTNNVIKLLNDKHPPSKQ